MGPGLLKAATSKLNPSPWESPWEEEMRERRGERAHTEREEKKRKGRVRRPKCLDCVWKSFWVCQGRD